MTIQDSAWNMDTGASSHLANNISILTSFSNSNIYPSVFVGNCHSIHVTHTGHSFLHTSSKPLQLNHILVTPHIIKNLISVCKFTRDNDVSVEFDAYGFSVKDYPTGRLLLRCDSTSSNKPTYDFLLPPIQTTTNVPNTKSFVQHVDEPNNPITPHPTTPPTNPPQPDTSLSHRSTPIPTSTQTQSHAQTVPSHTPIPTNNSSQTVSTHPMATRAKAGIFKPLERMNCHVTTTSPLPRSHVHALHDPNWKEAMLDEYNALITNGTWVLVPRLANVNVLRSMWLFKHKFHADGSLSRSWLSKLFPWYFCSAIGVSMFLSQSKFAEEILERAHMQNCNPCKALVDTESKLGSDGDPVNDPTNLYRSLAGVLQHLTFTRPNLSYAVQQVCLYMHDPRDPHFTALKRILRYVRGTLNYGLQLHVSSTTQLTVYTNADWAGCPVTRRSTSGYCVFLGDNILSWSIKRQVTLSRSSVEAEYRGVANVVAETAWIRNLLRELHTLLFIATLIYCDNVSAVYMLANPVHHQRTKHIEIDIHFVRDFVAKGEVRVLHVPLRFQYADIFTKGLPAALFLEFRFILNIRRPPISTTGEY
ncbi:ribonuclease H-like domain-containing protein [Tanacetum coccineum]